MRAMGATVLWGPDHVELGETEVATVGQRAAIALTRGRFAKLYSYVDPNEDVVAAVDGPRATLLVVADGHNGATAPLAAVKETLAIFGEDPPPLVRPDDWPAIFERINERVLASVQAPSPHTSSRTVLLVALVSDTLVSWGSFGDAALILAAPGEARGRQLNRELARFVGYPMSARAIEDLVQRGQAQIATDEYVVLATDGLSEFVSPTRPGDLVPRVLARAGASAGGRPGADVAARAIVDAACEAGAGDNVAVAVLEPLWSTPPPG